MPFDLEEDFIRPFRKVLIEEGAKVLCPRCNKGLQRLPAYLQKRFPQEKNLWCPRCGHKE